MTDLLAVYDSCLQKQPNAVNGFQDCGYQLAALVAMRTMSLLFFFAKIAPWFVHFNFDRSLLK
jgi:hypothetical protein